MHSIQINLSVRMREGEGLTNPSHVVECGLELTRAYQETSSPSRRMPGGQEQAARAVWRQADAVCLDVDSTVIRVEAIDLLAELCGVADEVAQL